MKASRDERIKCKFFKDWEGISVFVGDRETATRWEEIEEYWKNGDF